MVKNRAAKDAARKLKESTGITYPRALDRARLSGKTPSPFPALQIGWGGAGELAWRPTPGAVLEVSGATGSGKSCLLNSMAGQSTTHIETYVIDLTKGGADYSGLPGHSVLVDLEKVTGLANAIEAAPRPAIIFCDEFPWAPPWQPQEPALADTLNRVVEALKRLAGAGAAIVTATQMAEGWSPDSSRVLLGHSTREGRVAFLGHRGLESAGSLRGHFGAAGQVSVQTFCLRPETDKHYRKAPTVEVLGLPEEVMYFADAAPGLYLFAGLTGTGATSSMDALLGEMDRDNLRISLIETTAELTVPDSHGVFRVETGTWDMASSIKQAMRDSEVIVVGELCSTSTLMAALGAASAGYCVYAAIHAETAEGVIERVLDMVPEELLADAKAMMADSLRGILFHERHRNASGGRSFQVVRTKGNPDPAG